ncbi:unnamed protein product [Adineta steineri]|uniref:Uncharacterized protein n=1 Tax=Adineta steineri TaxID=433720 RepID=A0A814NSB2_9BILA|nr:unnamed protein product [Adineta steineri]CAF3806913.1 unnamed protein product [Adineta steineri]
MSTDALKPESSIMSYGSMEVSSIDTQRRTAILQPVSALKLVFDGISLVIVLLTWVLFKYLVKPVKQAFLCSDCSL